MARLWAYHQILCGDLRRMGLSGSSFCVTILCAERPIRSDTFHEPSLCSYAFNFSWEPDSCHGGCPGCSLLYTERICDECHFTRFPLGAVHSDYHHVERMDFLTLNWLGSRIRANSSTWLNTSADWKENRPKSSLQFFLSCHVKKFGVLLDSFLIGL